MPCPQLANLAEESTAASRTDHLLDRVRAILVVATAVHLAPDAASTAWYRVRQTARRSGRSAPGLVIPIAQRRSAALAGSGRGVEVCVETGQRIGTRGHDDLAHAQLGDAAGAVREPGPLAFGVLSSPGGWGALTPGCGHGHGVGCRGGSERGSVEALVGGW